MKSEPLLLPAPVLPAAGVAGPQYHLLAVGLALLGGVLGVVGALIQEGRSGGGITLPFIGAPIIEEVLKPAGIYILLIRWPQALRNQLYTALLTALSGLTFGVIESFVYVTLYVPDAGEAFVAYRFSVPLSLHATASYIFGLGINRNLYEWTQGRGPLPKASRNFFIAAILLHAMYNTAAVVLTLTGVLDIE